MSMQSKLGAVIFGLCTLFAASAMADPVIVGKSIDTDTRGGWMNTYGSCYNVVPQASPRTRFPEVEVGPDFQRANPGQYMNPPEGEIDSAVCIGGEAPDNFDVRVFSNAPATDGDPDSLPNHAFAWGFNEHDCVVDTPPGNTCSFMVREFTAQDNACLGRPYPSTFDSEDFAFDPLSNEIELIKGGNAIIAYYFLSEDWQCRSQDYVLTINGATPEGIANFGTVHDISNGTYLVFEINNIPDGAKILLDVTRGEPTCAGMPRQNGPNSHMSGIFVDGTDACLDPFCGDGNVDRELNETCEMPGDPTNDGGVCRDNCTYCGDGVTDPVEECDPAAPGTEPGTCSDTCEIIREVPSRTLGYWKTHPKVINGRFDGSGGYPSLLPLTFCGPANNIDDACDAVKYLSKGGGGIKKFKRQGMAALLNCEAFGCPTEIRNLIAEGSAACAIKDDNYRFGRTGGILADFNEANKDLPLPFKSGRALPKYCN